MRPWSPPLALWQRRGDARVLLRRELQSDYEKAVEAQRRKRCERFRGGRCCFVARDRGSSFFFSRSTPTSSNPATAAAPHGLALRPARRRARAEDALIAVLRGQGNKNGKKEVVGVVGFLREGVTFFSHTFFLFFPSSSPSKKQVTASSATLLDPSPSLLAPETFAFSRAFVFERVIGRSELSEVWLARHRGSGKRFAVKRSAPRPAPAAFASSSSSRKTAREVSVVARVPPHPNLVGVLRSWREGEQGSFVQMDYCRGGSLAEAVRRAARRSRRAKRRSSDGGGKEEEGRDREQAAAALPAALPEAAVWRVAAHASAALEALHAARVLHMDVKPENIYLDWEEEKGGGGEGTAAAVPAVVLRLGDFGISIPSAGGESEEEAPWEEGDGRYVAPELLSSSAAASSPRPTPAADVFSLGATLFECATGKPPPRGGEALPAAGAATAIVAAFAARPSSSSPSLSLLAGLVAAAMLPDPRARPSAAQLARACAEGDGACREGEADAALVAGLLLLPAPAAAAGGGVTASLPGSFSLLRRGDARRRGYTLDGSASLSLSADGEGEEGTGKGGNGGNAADEREDFDDDDEDEDSDALFLSRPPSAPRAGHSRRRTPRSAPSSPGREGKKEGFPPPATTAAAAAAAAAARPHLAPLPLLDPLVEAMSIGEGGEDGKNRHSTELDLERALSSMSIDGVGAAGTENGTENGTALVLSPGSPARSCSPWPAAAAAARARVPSPPRAPQRDALLFAATAGAPSLRFGFGLPAPAPPPGAAPFEEQGQLQQQQLDLSVEGLGDTVRQLSMSLSGRELALPLLAPAPPGVARR